MTFTERRVHWRISSRQLAPRFPLYCDLWSQGKTHNLLATSAYKARMELPVCAHGWVNNKQLQKAQNGGHMVLLQYDGS